MKKLLIVMLMSLACGASAAAESWPARPVRIIVPFPPGRSPDLIARMLTDKLAQAGRLKALAVTSSVRSVVVPELSTVAEAGFPGFESSAWIGMVAPAKTPKPIIERLSRELVTIIRSQDVREKMLRIYFQPVGTAPDGLSNLMRSERDRWAKVIKQSGARAD